MARVCPKRERLPSNGCIESDPAVKPSLPLGGHLKTDHRGSLQNRPMGITLDKNLFYRACCGGGNLSSGLIRFESGAGLERLAAVTCRTWFQSSPSWAGR